ncbi:MAG TPA: thiamine phosphate synthase [Gemmatimonadaceae bacterium]|nr:thiamine phosphate synthase [Gemmatimonadaceae bacterium]
MPLIDVPTVHAVTDTEILLDPQFRALAEQVFGALGPKGAVHLRGPGVSAARLLELAVELAPAAAASGGLLVINDRVDVALAAGGAAVRVTTRSLSPADARSLIGTAALGVGVHAVSEAHASRAAKPDWLIAGNIHETASHPARPGRGLDFISEVAAVEIPVIAIGGIGPKDAVTIRAAGAHGVAAIRGIWHAADPARAAAGYL